MGKPQELIRADMVEAERISLREEFPSWSIVRTTDTRRWWAMRPIERARSDVLPACDQVVTELDADSAEELRGKLRRVGEEEATGSRRRSGSNYMALPRDLWQDTLAALDSNDEQHRDDVSQRLRASAPHIWTSDVSDGPEGASGVPAQ
ncbi:hypothetical protein [Actinomadura terrae]|uniref:hypothetical protein n=1 Tax=Actinomadura terrae TaxID=604353 RepID=UPI001FA78A4D|nr:hypothetical protein [Actinomadura terrae]